LSEALSDRTLVDVGSVYVLSDGERAVPQPIHAGVPFAPGRLCEPGCLTLTDFSGAVQPVQAEVLARWTDGSVKWLLLDAVCPALPAGGSVWRLRQGSPADRVGKPVVRCYETAVEITIETGAGTFTLDKSDGTLLKQVKCSGNALLSEALVAVLADKRGRKLRPQVEHVSLEATGPVRATVRLEGRFRGRSPCHWVARLCFFAGTALVRVRFTLHNPRKAQHKGGLWDLNDPGSIHFQELALTLGAPQGPVSWVAEPSQPAEQTPGTFEIYQDSSGGEAWQSRSHIDHSGESPSQFRGYRVRHAAGETYGLRATPLVTLQTPAGAISAAFTEFWQQFPKAITVENGRLTLGLFPHQAKRTHELQGGEQKTHTCWLHFQPGTGGADALAWLHQPAWMAASPEAYQEAGVWKYLGIKRSAPEERYDRLLENVLDGPESIKVRREITDEFGWRHFGDWYADHEQAYFTGSAPIISHYNNQYDVVLGCLLHYLRTGDRRWWDLADPLARHVTDIDIYHTTEDKAAYNGGLFWHTDHYKDAATSTHRCYSRANQIQGRHYGGGPCNEHNYTTGLLFYYYLTGEPTAREAVLSLANWVIGMDEGRGNIFGLVDDGPTGSASRTTEADYHGPGRGCGNSVNALLDGWLLTAEARYLNKAEELIRRAIHPADDVATRDLLNVELRWSYTVFLTVLARYLDLKAEAGQQDAMFAYAQASLRRYATWMLDHETAYFDDPSKLEYPTETWAAQELRKANVLRLAAAHADEAMRPRLLKRGRELADRAWDDLFRFEKPGTTRALAIVLTEGLKDAVFRGGASFAATRVVTQPIPDGPARFIPQRQRVLAQIKSIRGLSRTLLRLTNPYRWARYSRRHPGRV